CRIHQLTSPQLNAWKAEFLANAALVFQRDHEGAVLAAQIHELECLVGQLTPTLGQKRTVVKQLAATFPVALLCRLVGLPRSSYYYAATGSANSTLHTQIRQVLAQFPTYGVRRITAQLRRDFHVQVNHKRVARALREMSVNRKNKRKKRKTTQSQHEFPRYPNLVQDLCVERPNQVWVSDITYIHLAHED